MDFSQGFSDFGGSLGILKRFGETLTKYAKCVTVRQSQAKKHMSRLTTATGIAETHGTTQHFSPLLMEIYGDLWWFNGDLRWFYGY